MGAQRQTGDYGAFAPLVFERAAEGDGVALRDRHAAARAVGALSRAARALGAERVALVGGVGQALRPYLVERRARRCANRSRRDRRGDPDGGRPAASEGGEAMRRRR